MRKFGTTAKHLIPAGRLGLGLMSWPKGGTSGTVGTSAPSNTVLPVATFRTTAVVGNYVDCTTGTWTGTPAYTYQWLADGVVIAGATTNAYQLQAAEQDKMISCRVTGTNAGGSDTATTATIGPVTGLVPVNSVAPAQTVDAIGNYPGGTVTAGSGTWSNSPSAYGYQWQEDGVDIAGATTTTYLLPVGKIGKTIRCKVVAVNAAGNSAPAYSTGSRLLWSPAALSGHLQWVDTSRDDMVVETTTCSQLTDMSGNGNHWVQAVGAQQPTRTLYAELNNRKAVRFPGPGTTGPYMTTAIAYTGTVFTSIVVFRWLPTAEAATIVANYTNAAESGSGASGFQLATRATTTTNWRSQIGGTVTPSQVLAADTPASMLSVLTLTDKQASLNGATNVTAASGASMNWTRGALGAGQNAGSISGVRLQGDVMEIYTNSNALSAADQAKLQGYAAHKWSPSMVTALPAGHTYKAAAP